MTTDVDDFLVHYGVKGMKWGVVKKDPDRKSNHRVNLEAHYIKKGLSSADAALSADRRIKVEKVIALAGATSLVAVAGYAAGNYIGREFADVKLKQGTPLQHVTSTADLELKNLPFFTTFNKTDKKNIHALFPQQYQVDLKAASTITAPSNFKARQYLSEVLGQKKTMTSDEYARFNYRYFYDDSEASKKVVSDFFGKVKDAGYNSVLDPKPGGYAVAGMRARLNQPLILLDGASSAIKTGQRAVDSQFRNKVTTEVMTKKLAANIASMGAVGGAYGATVYGAAVRDKAVAVDAYFKKYPTSTYTRSEVTAMLQLTTTGYGIKNN